MTIYPPLDAVLRLHAELVGPDLVRDRGQVAANLARPAGGRSTRSSIRRLR